MKNFLLIIIVFLSVLFSGCTVRHGDFTVISNKLTRLSEFEVDKANRVKNVTGKDVQHIIIFIPTGGPPTVEAAVDDALEKGDGDLMTDAVIHCWNWYIPYIYGQVGWSVKGDVVKTRKN
ncbi:hypothetical protein [Trichloromonas sp.]|jgi:hypothetical protein|uniref:hypothetical protein n=1 Tax=Trichloromonas sp. TaxID=3069249 RepID=UPI002A4D99C4|nr:hypothetical protein [Trichloromonas sp.]